MLSKVHEISLFVIGATKILFYISYYAFKNASHIFLSVWEKTSCSAAGLKSSFVYLEMCLLLQKKVSPEQLQELFHCRPVAYGSSPGYEAASATPCIQPPPPLHSSSAGSARRSGSARVSEEAAFQSRLCYSVVSELLMYGVTHREIIHMEGYPGSFPPSSTLPAQ